VGVADFSKVISTILKHDRRQTSYKLALVCAINDVALSFPNTAAAGQSVVIPLRMLAEWWFAYYWPFCDPVSPILQGPDTAGHSDMEFRTTLTRFRELWEAELGGLSGPADGFLVINELRIMRKQSDYSANLRNAYYLATKAIIESVKQPIEYAGPVGAKVFRKPVRCSQLNNVIPLPGTLPDDLCLVVEHGLWSAFLELSLWIEAVCIHEWCLFTERVAAADRGAIYVLLTARPDNRRPLTWERHQVDLLLLEGTIFICPWTEKRIHRPDDYDLDHLVPIAIYPINEMWNLVPADPKFNTHIKRDRLPTLERLSRAEPLLANTYRHYLTLPTLAQALADDVLLRFSMRSSGASAQSVAATVMHFIASVAEARNVARF
jgi:hypothetical protein